MKASKYVLATHGVDSDGDFATKYVKVSGNYFLISMRTLLTFFFVKYVIDYHPIHFREILWRRQEEGQLSFLMK